VTRAPAGPFSVKRTTGRRAVVVATATSSARG
jgi:hypothetical protein